MFEFWILLMLVALLTGLVILVDEERDTAVNKICLSFLLGCSFSAAVISKCL